MSRTLGLLVLIAFCVLAPAHATEPLLQIGQPQSNASFLGCKSDNTLQFQIANKKHAVPLGDLIRWSNPRGNVDRPEAILVDGSRLVLAESWSWPSPGQAKRHSNFQKKRPPSSPKPSAKSSSPAPSSKPSSSTPHTACGFATNKSPPKKPTTSGSPTETHSQANF